MKRAQSSPMLYSAGANQHGFGPVRLPRPPSLESMNSDNVFIGGEGLGLGGTLLKDRGSGSGHYDHNNSGDYGYPPSLSRDLIYNSNGSSPARSPLSSANRSRANSRTPEKNLFNNPENSSYNNLITVSSTVSTPGFGSPEGIGAVSGESTLQSSDKEGSEKEVLAAGADSEKDVHVTSQKESEGEESSFLHNIKSFFTF